MFAPVHFLAAFLAWVVACFGALVVRGRLAATLASSHPETLARLGPPVRAELDPIQAFHRAVAWFRFLQLLGFRRLGDARLNRICWFLLCYELLLLALPVALILAAGHGCFSA